MKYSSIVLLLPLVALPASGDSIVLDHVTHHNVLIRESPSLYYVQFPESGEVRSIPKTAINPDSVTIETAGAERDQLLAEWKSANAGIRGAHVPASMDTAAAENVRPVIERPNPQALQTVVLRLKGEPQQRRAVRADFDVNGQTYYANLNTTSLRDALTQLVAPMSLDTAVRSGMIRVADGRSVPPVSFNDLESRYYALSDTSGTLPKIIVSNPAANALGSSPFAASTFGAGSTTGGQGGFGGGQAGFGGAGGGGGFGGGGAGAGGGAGGGGFGGGGQGGFGGGAINIQNISQLFSTIDDRLVGERPNMIVQLYGGAR